MLRNIEIKARLVSVEELLPTVRRVAQQGPWEIAQDDTYFACASGRLKLREAHELMRQLGVSSAQLIEGGYLELLAGTPAHGHVEA